MKQSPRKKKSKATSSRPKRMQTVTSPIAQRLMTASIDAQFELTSFKHVSDLLEGDELTELLRSLYSSPRIQDKAMATIINGIAHSKKIRFTLSKRILSRMLKSDPNIHRSDINGEENKTVMNNILATSSKSGLIEKVEDFSYSGEGKPAIAAWYRLADHEVAQLLRKSTPELYPPSLPGVLPTLSTLRLDEHSSDQIGLSQDKTNTMNTAPASAVPESIEAYLQPENYFQRVSMLNTMLSDVSRRPWANALMARVTPTSGYTQQDYKSFYEGKRRGYCAWALWRLHGLVHPDVPSADQMTPGRIKELFE